MLAADVVVGWVTAGLAYGLWPDADALDDDVLTAVLEAAHDQCVAYLDESDVDTDPDPVPSRWQLAQVSQARAVWRAMRSTRDNQAGAEALGVTVFPMDWTVQQLLVPKRRKPTFA
ncbi:MAG: hypothetical protein FWF90_15655 [Promicromonosporaceae bacterium]|nr:hypothetical protein [Promicromonosporaceae bacterium]